MNVWIDGDKKKERCNWDICQWWEMMMMMMMIMDRCEINDERWSGRILCVYFFFSIFYYYWVLSKKSREKIIFLEFWRMQRKKPRRGSKFKTHPLWVSNDTKNAWTKKKSKSNSLSLYKKYKTKNHCRLDRSSTSSTSTSTSTPSSSSSS